MQKKALVQAELKKLHSPDAFDLEGFSPDGSFGILVQTMVGPLGSDGEESFDVVVCTTEWFAANMNSEIVSGRHHLFVKQYDYQALRRYIENYCDSCQGESWEAVSVKLGRLGHWEFEDYMPRRN